MAIEKTNVVDAIGIDRATGEAVLTLADSADWSTPDAHLSLLRAKLDAYMSFVRSGELLECYPIAHGRAPRIDVIFRIEPPAAAIDLLAQFRGADVDHPLPVAWRVYAGG